MPAVAACPDAGVWRQFLIGQLPEESIGELQRHLAGCSSCEERLASLGDDDSLVDAVRSAQTPVPIGDDVADVMDKLRQLVSSFTGIETSQPSGEATPPSAELSMPATEDTYPFLEPPQAPGELGRLSTYRILHILGKGGMGVVFAAEDLLLKRRVALKVIKPQLAVNPRTRQRFLREAQSAAALENERIVTVYHVGEQQGIPYLAMPLLVGESLEDRLRRASETPLPLAESLQLGREIALGLAFAHHRGVLHRDIKPGNIWIEIRSDMRPRLSAEGETEGATSEAACRYEGHVKILDFGLARALEDDVHLTQEGAIVGTPNYMAPEQASGDKIDGRSDLFSLGCILYRMAAGRPAFQGLNTVSALRSVAFDQPVPPRDLNPAVPVALSDLILSLLAKKPAERPASADEVADALAKIETAVSQPAAQTVARTTSASSVSESPAKAAFPPRARRRLLAAAVLLLAFGPLGYFFGGTIIRFATNQGELVIQVADKDVEVKIMQNGVVVQDKTSKREFTLTAGKGEIEVLEKDGIKLATKKFELTRGGKTTVTVTFQELADARKVKDSPLAGDPDRRAAEWVLSIGGIVIVKTRSGQHEQQVAEARKLPAESFDVIEIHCPGCPLDDGDIERLKQLKGLTNLMLRATRVTDDGLEKLKEVKGLTGLNLHETVVTGAGLRHLSAMKNLKYLALVQTQVDDAGMVHISGLTNLQELDLANTRVSDAGLKNLEHLTKLGRLNLQGTKVITAAGVAALQKSIPECKIVWAGSESPDRRAAEWVLSVGGAVRVRLKDQELHFYQPADQLPKEPFLLVNLTLENDHPTDAGLANLKDCKSLTYLCLSGPFTDAGLSHFRDCNLTTLTLNTPTLTDAGLAHFKDCKNLMVLNLMGTKVTDAGLVHFKDCKNMTGLYLRFPNVTDAGLTHFKDCKNLTHLYLTCGQVTDLGLANFKDLKNLSDLTLGAMRVTDAGLAHFKDCKNLTFLCLGVTGVTDAGLAHFKECKNLTNLILHQTQVRDAGLAHFKDCKNLTELRLGATQVTDAGLDHFKDCKSLTMLFVHDTQVTDAGLAHFKDCKALGILSIGATNVSDAGLAQFKDSKNLHSINLDNSRVSDASLEVLAGLPALTQLSMLNTRISRQGVDQLQGALPNCKIEWLEPNRHAAEQVLALGGEVEIATPGKDDVRAVKAADALPKDLFQVRRISVKGVKKPLEGPLGALWSLKFAEFDRLEAIDLSGTSSPPVLEALAVIHGLKELNLSGSMIGRDFAFLTRITALQDLTLAKLGMADDQLATFPKLPKLKRLVLDDNPILGRSLGRLQNQPELTDLSLNCPSIGDLLAKNLGELKRLKRLSLVGANLTDAGIRHLEGLTNLTFLDLRKTKASAEGIAALQKALPKCKIIGGPVTK